PGRQHRYQHPRHARHHGVAGGLRVVHPVQREDEQRRREDGGDLGDGVRHCFLNIFSIRFVMRNPLTMFVMEANSAIPPRTRMVHGYSAPVTAMDPTTAIAEIAFVSDMSGVYRSRDTRRITPSPMNVARTRTNSMDQKSTPAWSFMPSAPPRRASRTCRD